MLLFDVNVLVYAHRADAADHTRYREWLERMLSTEPAFGMAELVLSGFIRVVTHPKVFRDPSPPEPALAFAEAIRDHPQCILVAPGPQHWEIFVRLCRTAGAKGNLIADAYLAALAIESGTEWITTDRDYARFPGLRCRHPLQ
ncbi:MAG: type II toxin-antitoxin system VapC family toxin [Betaproteobacteria bacterium]|nr:type II toxin-antitoxin system VapC family toxin [Betaproteobacteria bacterium]